VYTLTNYRKSFSFKISLCLQIAIASYPLKIFTEFFIFIFFFFETNGDCLYSSTSLALFGDNRFVDELRAMVCIELFLNATFYINHPILESNKPSSFSLLLSNKTFDIKCESRERLVQFEAIHNCSSKTFSSLLSVLGLSTVIGRQIQMLYPDSGAVKFKSLFNSLISPKSSLNDSEILNILFFREGIQPGKLYQANHFVPIVVKNFIETYATDEFPTLSFEEKGEPSSKIKKGQSQRFISFMPISTSSSQPTKHRTKTITKPTPKPISSSIFNFMKHETKENIFKSSTTITSSLASVSVPPVSLCLHNMCLFTLCLFHPRQSSLLLLLKYLSHLINPVLVILNSNPLIMNLMLVIIFLLYVIIT